MVQTDAEINALTFNSNRIKRRKLRARTSNQLRNGKKQQDEISLITAKTNDLHINSLFPKKYFYLWLEKQFICGLFLYVINVYLC